MPTVTAPGSKRPSLIERTRLRALMRSVNAARSGRPLRAAFWAGCFWGLGGLRR